MDILLTLSSIIFILILERQINQHVKNYVKLTLETREFSLYFSNFPIILLDFFDKINTDDFRSHKEFLKKLYLELAKQLFYTNIEEGAFLNLLKILNKIIDRFNTFAKIQIKERIINS